MKKIIVLSLFITLFGCEDTANLTKPSDNKKYFVCVDLEITDSVESVLYIDTDKKRIEIRKLEWENYSQDEQKLYAKKQGDGWDNTINFNFVTGRLEITASNYFENSYYNGVSNYNYQCRKTDPLM